MDFLLELVVGVGELEELGGLGLELFVVVLDV